MHAKSPPSKPWSGRFTASADSLVEGFTASVGFDQRLYRQDIAGSIAHATMLARAGVLTDGERDAIVAGLEQIEAEIEAGDFVWRRELEDVHMNIEAALTERIGDTGKKLHTGRSRNDQVATDMRLYLRGAADALCEELRALMSVMLDIAEREADTPMPGFTHMQCAQPVTFGHHVMAWFEMLARDVERLEDARRRINRLPLGAAALAGTGYPIDREFCARMLGFDGVCENSLDAVSDRDFCIEFTAACALIMVHFSRLAEELVWWSSAQFGFVELDDAHSTGSSIMPQKKNPDVPELLRGKSGRVFGDLQALLVMVKGQPLAYNSDNQEDKEAVFDALDTVGQCVEVVSRILPALGIDRDRMRIAAEQDFSTATDLADYLVANGVPFREAHAVVGKIVRAGIESGRTLSDFSLPEFQAFSPVIAEDVYARLTVAGSLAARNHIGGTAPEQVRSAIARARTRLAGS